MSATSWTRARRTLLGREDATAWLARHRLPASPAGVELVDERLRERRVSRAVTTVVFAALLATLLVTPHLMPMLAAPDDRVMAAVLLAVLLAAALDVGVRALVWRRWDRRLAERLRVRVAPLSPPSWDDLVGVRFLRRAAVLLVAAAGYSGWLGHERGAARGVVAGTLVLVAAAQAVVLLETARRRRVVAGDVEALAIDDRLRGEEAGQSVPSAVGWVALMPLLAPGDPWAAAFVLGVLLTVGVVRHRYAWLAIDGRVLPR